MRREHDIGGLDLSRIPWTRHERNVCNTYLRSQVTQGLAHAGRWFDRRDMSTAQG